MTRTKITFGKDNIVSNKIEFECENGEIDDVLRYIAERDVFNNTFAIDFDKIIPRPNYLYPCGTNEVDDNDFVFSKQWHLQYWGTEGFPFNRYTVISDLNDLKFKKVSMFFDTFFTEKNLLPYNIIVGISHLLDRKFIHKYYVEKNEVFWGVEKWGTSLTVPCKIARIEKRFRKEDDLIGLRKEFLDLETLINLLVSERCKTKKKKNDQNV